MTSQKFPDDFRAGIPVDITREDTKGRTCATVLSAPTDQNYSGELPASTRAGSTNLHPSATRSTLLTPALVNKLVSECFPLETTTPEQSDASVRDEFLCSHPLRGDIYGSMDLAIRQLLRR